MVAEKSFTHCTSKEDFPKFYHSYSYNKSVITKLHSSGYSRELKGGYKL